MLKRKSVLGDEPELDRSGTLAYFDAIPILVIRIILDAEILRSASRKTCLER